MPTIDLNGTTLHYLDTGAGRTGETIAFSHGLLWDHTLFTPQIEALRSEYRCIAWDHRGQGASATDHRHTIDMELLTQDAAALLDALDTGPVHVAGLSMGGFVAMRLAVRRPDLVRSLMLLDTSALPEPLENVGRYRKLSTASRYLPMRLLRSRVAPIMFGTTIRADKSRASELNEYVRRMTMRSDIWRAVNGVIDRAGIIAELASVRVPTLVLVGDEDVATTPEKAAALQAAIAGAQLVTIAGAGHSSTVEQPEAVTQALAQFLAAACQES